LRKNASTAHRICAHTRSDAPLALQANVSPRNSSASRCCQSPRDVAGGINGTRRRASRQGSENRRENQRWRMAEKAISDIAWWLRGIALSGIAPYHRVAK
jgi:hypothetical protein